MTVSRQVARLWAQRTYRPRLRCICRSSTGLWPSPFAEASATVVGGSHVALGRACRLLRGATLIANGGSIAIGAKSFVGRYSVVQSVGGRVVIGERSGVGDFCSLYGQGGLTIGDDVLMGSGVRILTETHGLHLPGPVAAAPVQARPTTIADGAWLAANCVIVAGVSVGRGAVVAAGAVVLRDVPDRAVVGGVPADVLSFRGTTYPHAEPGP